MFEFLMLVKTGRNKAQRKEDEVRRLAFLTEHYESRLRLAPGKELKTLDDDSFEVFRLYREKVAHEDILINFRTSWFVALQAFLFSAFALSLGRNGHYIPVLPAFLFSLVGLFSCVATYISVIAADRAIGKTCKKWTDQYFDEENGRYLAKGVRDIVDPMGILPPVRGGGSDGRIHRMGAFLSKGLPIGLSLFWSVLGCLVVLFLFWDCSENSRKLGECIYETFMHSFVGPKSGGS
jgi:hypothetical protein